MKKIQKVRGEDLNFFNKIRILYCAKKFFIPFLSMKVEETW
jgi:hypothetical protein